METTTIPYSEYTESLAIVINTLPNKQAIKNTEQIKTENETKQTTTKHIAKEIGPIPYEAGSLDIKLNRTSRKNVPDVLNHKDKNIKLNVDNQLDNEPMSKSNLNENSSDHLFEIKLHNLNDTRQVQTTVFVTTRKFNRPGTLFKGEVKPSTTTMVISPTVHQLSVPKLRIKSLYINETIAPKLSAQKFDVSSEEIMKQHYLPKPLLSIGLAPKSSKTFSEQTADESLESKSESQPRPNRQRQLTRMQRRSFYPYFFSRVLG